MLGLVEFLDLLDHIRWKRFIHRFERCDDRLNVRGDCHNAKLENFNFLIFDATLIVIGVLQRAESNAHCANQAKLDFAPCGIKAVFQFTIGQLVRLRNCGGEWDIGLRRLAEYGLAYRLIMLMFTEQSNGICELSPERVDGIAYAIDGEAGRNS